MDYPPPPPPARPDPPVPPTYPLPTSNVGPAAPAYQPYEPYQPSPQPGYPPQAPPALYAYRLPKDKTTAVLLAIFLGYTTWMYTYERDAWKFWVAFAITLADIILSVITFGIWLFVAIPAGIGIWLWGIVDTAAKPQQFYDLYPAA